LIGLVFFRGFPMRILCFGVFLLCLLLFDCFFLLLGFLFVGVVLGLLFCMRICLVLSFRRSFCLVRGFGIFLLLGRCIVRLLLRGLAL